MKSCDDEACQVLQTINIITREAIMMDFRKCSMSVKGRLMERLVREAVRMIDAMTSERNYSVEKCPDHYALIKKKEEYALQRKTTALLKHSTGFKMNETRDCSINKN